MLLRARESSGDDNRREGPPGAPRPRKWAAAGPRCNFICYVQSLSGRLFRRLHDPGTTGLL